MRRSVAVFAAAVSLLIAAFATTASSAAAVQPTDAGRDFGLSHRVCAAAAPGLARCHAWAKPMRKPTGGGGGGTTFNGYTPADIKAAYKFPTTADAGAGKTIAIVDAYDSPFAAGDLDAFSSAYNLPRCNNVDPCFFKKVDQAGGTNYPAVDGGWALEISLDIQWAHAVAPGANILLVEANSNSFADLMVAEDYAKANANYVSNSWGSSEFSGEATYDGHFSQPGVSFFVSAGDNGTPAEYPSSSPNVVSVGGTKLTMSGSTVTSEVVWSNGGGGCSAVERATTAQASYAQYGQARCGGRRATPDVSLDADPSTGVKVYDSTPYNGTTGWYIVGGTSASAPMIAGRSAALGGVPATLVDSAYLYTVKKDYRDITSGTNGARCLVGFDLCAGLGSWMN